MVNHHHQSLPTHLLCTNEQASERTSERTSRCGLEGPKDIADESDGEACFSDARVSENHEFESVFYLCVVVVVGAAGRHDGWMYGWMDRWMDRSITMMVLLLCITCVGPNKYATAASIDTNTNTYKYYKKYKYDVLFLLSKYYNVSKIVLRLTICEGKDTVGSCFHV
jgi:hypothetical protein